VKKLLSVKNLKVSVQDKLILDGINLNIKPGEVHAIMGPNGSGKSSLANTIMGHPKYQIQDGEMNFCDQQINSLSPDKRAKLGLFLTMQAPVEIEGITLGDFLRQIYDSLNQSSTPISPKEFNKLASEKLALLKANPDFLNRYLNVGFSGGEKKMSEILQLAIAQPKLAILDELDSGLDVDALKNVCAGLNEIKRQNPNMAILLITHYQRILDYIEPNFVHVLQNGKIIRSGDKTLATTLEKEGYKA